MPFQSESQRRYMWKFLPAIARRWSKHYGSKPIHKSAITRRLKGNK